MAQVTGEADLDWGPRDLILEVFELGAAEFADKHTHSKPSVDGSSHHYVSWCSPPISKEALITPVSQMRKLSHREVTQLASGLTTQSGSKDGTVVKFATP